MTSSKQMTNVNMTDASGSRPTYIGRNVTPSIRRSGQDELENVDSSFNQWTQCDKIGLFLKDLGFKFSFKSSPNIL